MPSDLFIINGKPVTMQTILGWESGKNYHQCDKFGVNVQVSNPYGRLKDKYDTTMHGRSIAEKLVSDLMLSTGNCEGVAVLENEAFLDDNVPRAIPHGTGGAKDYTFQLQAHNEHGDKIVYDCGKDDILMRILQDMDARHFLVTRNEWISKFDYQNFWHHRDERILRKIMVWQPGLYPHGSFSERLRQIAYEMKTTDKLAHKNTNNQGFGNLVTHFLNADHFAYLFVKYYDNKELESEDRGACIDVILSKKKQEISKLVREERSKRKKVSLLRNGADSGKLEKSVLQLSDVYDRTADFVDMLTKEFPLELVAKTAPRPPRFSKLFTKYEARMCMYERSDELFKE